jgi:hypothetical protein
LGKGFEVKRFGCKGPAFASSVIEVVVCVDEIDSSDGISTKGRPTAGLSSGAVGDAVLSCAPSSSRTSVVRDVFCEGDAREPVNSSASSSSWTQDAFLKIVKLLHT